MTNKSIVLAIGQWPEIDRARWEAGTSVLTSFLDDHSPATNWRARTKKCYELSYGRWLGWLTSKGLLDEAQHPSARLTQELVRTYIADLQRKNKPESVFNRIVGLERTLFVIASDWDRKILTTALRKLPRGSDRSRKHMALQETAALVDLGLTLMKRAESEIAPSRPRERAARFRDGLQIALLAMRPLRVKNFAGMELGKNLVQRQGQWWLVYSAEDVKNHQPIEVPFPNELILHLEKYLGLYRVLLAGNRYNGAHVWISTHYRGEWRGTIYQKIMWLTEEAFGRGLNPHLFRDAMATSLAINNPQIVNLAHAMLGNTLATTQRFYNLSRSVDAARQVTTTLDQLRNKLTKTRRDTRQLKRQRDRA